MKAGSFDLLTPDAVVAAVEQATGRVLDGTLNPYPSYINRVYGLKTDSGEELVAKFYRPGRWTREAVLEEHRFLLDCAEAEIPVVAPLAGPDGGTVHRAVVAGDDAEEAYNLACFPKMGGRNFDAESDEDWFRLGAVVGRCHAVGAKREAPHRLVFGPELTAGFVEELASGIHPKFVDDFRKVSGEILNRVTPLFEGVGLQRIHGDCHRGNILDRPGWGLLVIDFDDMMSGPAVQDLWLLLPGYAVDCGRELESLIEGYEGFAAFDRRTLRLIEPLRFMRMVYFLAWRARQSDDYGFRRNFPEWGGEAFWLKEVEDLRVQATVIEASIED
jgi:Ser/Thr protein kinase RdoA (MazF antagonist)